jgi:hypothetical protein
VLLLSLVCACAHSSGPNLSSAQRGYPMNGYTFGSLPPRAPEQVEVLFGGSAPACPHTEIATVVYDSMKDGKMTSETVALDGLREQAAHLGATGIYKVELIAGATVGHGFAGSGLFMGAAGQETGARAVAFVCPLIADTPRSES